jgi:hypothetical protein
VYSFTCKAQIGGFDQLPDTAPQEKKKKGQPTPERVETKWDRANAFNMAVAQAATAESTKNADRTGPNYESPYSGGLVVQSAVKKDGTAEAGAIPLGERNAAINRDYMKQLKDANYDPAQITNPHLKSNIDALTEREQRRVIKKAGGEVSDSESGFTTDAEDNRLENPAAMADYYSRHTKDKPNHAEDDRYHSILQADGKVEDHMFTKVSDRPASTVCIVC